MSTYHDIKNSRRLVWIGILIGYATAAGIAAANLASEEGTPLTAIAFLITFAIPPTLALISLDRRPSLLAVAGMGAALQSVTLLTSLGLVGIVPAMLWFLAARRRPRAATPPRGAAVIRPLLAAATLVPLLVMLVHLDPVCTTTRDGEVVRTFVDEEARTGWSLQLGTSSSSSSSGTETTACVSNRIVTWEALASVGTATLYLILVVARWPTSDALATRAPAGNGLRSTNDRRV